ncbi:MAG TPA: iron-containing alcohol dehydrogenase [Solirubrobacteraceae bacterium]|nr:iron-containing alcohol dehydrogenase [Solirubrobacteraceae bacterium]
MVPRPRTVEIPRLLHVSAGCLRDVGVLLGDHDFDLSCVLLGSGPGPSRMFAERVGTSLRDRGVRVLHLSHLSGRLDQAAATASTIIEEGATTAVAVGGGRVIDTVKLAAARTGVDFVSVPTTVSNDGISSPIASLMGRDGARCSHAARMPCGIVVDVTAIGSAPTTTIRAGVGDLVSNLTACLDWRLADREGHEQYDAFAAMIAESAARPILDLAELASPASLAVVAEGLLLSGLAMAAAGTSRPCSGAEHLISHALDAQLGPAAVLHGEQVALGCLVAAAAHEWSQAPGLLRTFRRLGLPTCPEDLGISREQLVAAVSAAPGVRPDRHTILARFVERGDVERLVMRAFDAPLPALEQLPLVSA